MPKPVNPYRAGNPISDQEGFFGREEFTQWVRTEFERMASSVLVFEVNVESVNNVLLQLQRLLPKEEFLPSFSICKRKRSDRSNRIGGTC